MAILCDTYRPRRNTSFFITTAALSPGELAKAAKPEEGENGGRERWGRWLRRPALKAPRRAAGGGG